MTRGFEEVEDNYKEYEKVAHVHGKTITLYPDTKLPTRADERSAGYDLYSPVDITVLPNQAEPVFLHTNVKVFMPNDEVFMIYPRSSLSIKHGITLANSTGVIDSSYYGNLSNDGNIAVALINMSGKAYHIKAGERVAQGVFMKYLTTDDDATLSTERTGGFGSSGR